MQGLSKVLNYRNSIFVDNTASQAVAASYSGYLRNSIAVVACNKIACSSRYADYKTLKQLAKEFNAPLLFETNVGAGLPIIDTLKHLIASGDKVRKIQAVLSGSLNFVFNTFNNTATFHDVVQQAQEKGYTEPHPTIDLSDIDVIRKILILARESGYTLEPEERASCIMQEGSVQFQERPAPCRKSLHSFKSVLQPAGRVCTISGASCTMQEGSVQFQECPAACRKGLKRLQMAMQVAD